MYKHYKPFNYCFTILLPFNVQVLLLSKYSPRYSQSWSLNLKCSRVNKFLCLHSFVRSPQNIHSWSTFVQIVNFHSFIYSLSRSRMILTTYMLGYLLSFHTNVKSSDANTAPVNESEVKCVLTSRQRQGGRNSPIQFANGKWQHPENATVNGIRLPCNLKTNPI